MKVCLLTNTPSPHQLPFARELAARVPKDDFVHLTTEGVELDRQHLGWGDAADKPEWLKVAVPWEQCVREAVQADVLLTGFRDVALFRERNALKRHTFYMSERWFKPPSGMLRALHPGFLRMVLSFRRQAQSPYFHYLPIGRFAATDLIRILSFKNQMGTWGYFIGVSEQLKGARPQRMGLTVLWCGRYLGWKRVDLLIEAVGTLLNEGHRIRLRLVGAGPEETCLRKMAEAVNRRSSVACASPYEQTHTRTTSGGQYSSFDWLLSDQPITFLPPVAIADVREHMRRSHVYVLPSSGYEGWGVVVNEAMAEGCAVVVSDAAGAGSTLIRNGKNGLLFKSGDARALAGSLRTLAKEPALGERLGAVAHGDMVELWTPAVAAERFLSFSKACVDGRPLPVFEAGPLSCAL